MKRMNCSFEQLKYNRLKSFLKIYLSLKKLWIDFTLKNFLYLKNFLIKFLENEKFLKNREIMKSLQKEPWNIFNLFILSYLISHVILLLAALHLQYLIILFFVTVKSISKISNDRILLLIHFLFERFYILK